jgi:hypothetical protein
MAEITDFLGIYESARAWRDKCLVGDGSLFGSERLWTLENFSELKRLYVDRPDESKRSFMDKLKDQLAEGSPEAKRLAAELFWPMLLFSASQKPATKIIKMRLVWQWSGAVFPEDIEALDSSLLTGIGSTGPAFQNQFWREYAYAIRLFLAIKVKPKSERMELLSDGWVFAVFMDELDESHARQLYHMLAHLLFPDRFERMASRTHKGLIISHFGDLPSVDGWRDRLETDKALYEVRASLGTNYGKDFDYYATKALRDVWYPTSGDLVDPESGPLAAIPTALPERYGNSRFWVIGAGEKGFLWDAFKESGYIALGFDNYGQAVGSATRDEILERLSGLRDGDQKPTNGALALYQFASVMREGDYVFAKRGRSTLLGFGRVTSGYTYQQGARGSSHRRTVRWLRTGPWQLPPERRITTKSLTDFTRYADWLAYVLALIGESGDVHTHEVVSENFVPYAPREPARAYGIESLLADGAFLEREEIRKALDAWEDKANLILSGPPGTGKSWLAARLAWIMIGAEDTDRLLRIQFHQSYAYEDFIRGWKPGAGSFELRDGPFLNFCERARADGRRPYVVLIEEINRGDISRVFGELFFLLEKDKRDSRYAMHLSCSKDGEAPFFVPPNLYLIGTMNTADRSIAVVDYALRRRFAVVPLKPAFDRDAFSDFMASEKIEARSELIARIVESMTELNNEIAHDRNLGPGYAIGHSYFTSVSGDDDDADVDEPWYRSIIETQIMPTLEEYWFDRHEKVEQWRKMLLP